MIGRAVRASVWLTWFALKSASYHLNILNYFGLVHTYKGRRKAYKILAGMLLWHSDLFQPLRWTWLDLLWEAWEYYRFNPVSLTLLLFLVRKGKSLYCRYCSFSLAPSRSGESGFLASQTLFSLSFSQAVLTPRILNKCQNNAHSFYSPVSTS